MTSKADIKLHGIFFSELQWWKLYGTREHRTKFYILESYFDAFMCEVNEYT